MDPVAAAQVLQPLPTLLLKGQTAKQIHIFRLGKPGVKSADALEGLPTQHPGTGENCFVAQGLFDGEASALAPGFNDADRLSPMINASPTAEHVLQGRVLAK
jgi:hypothetical protein